MASSQKNKQIFFEQTEIKPNRYAVNVLIAVVGVIAVVCLLNEIGVFVVNKPLVRICLAITVALFSALQVIVRNRRLVVHPAVKYVILVAVLFDLLTISVLLNINAVLAYALPLFIATQYRSYRVSGLALGGACIVCIAAPVLAYFFGTWSQSYLTGYIETVCNVSLTVKAGSALSQAEAIRNIMLYLALPQVLTLCALGVILMSVTKSGKDSVNNMMHISDLSFDLNNQLKSILSMQEKFLLSMSDIIESRDSETGGHVKRTSDVVRMLTDAMRNDPASGVTAEFCSCVVKVAPMHDLGKIAIPDEILRKPGRLTNEEYKAVQLHPLKSAEIIKQVLTGLENEKLLATAVNLAMYHHERMDGKGYPCNLSGNQIPLEARIMSIADVYDALVSERCYKAPMSFEQAFNTIEQSMGSQFDPALNPYFVACRQQIEQYYASARTGA